MFFFCREYSRLIKKAARGASSLVFWFCGFTFYLPIQVLIEGARLSGCWVLSFEIRNEKDQLVR